MAFSKIRSGVIEEFVNELEVRPDLFEILVVDGCACCPGESGHFQVKQPALDFVYLTGYAGKTVGEQFLEMPLTLGAVAVNEISHQPYRKRTGASTNRLG
jgi:hypothetical protein